MKSLMIFLVVALSMPAFALEVKVADVKDSDFKNHSISLWKIKNQYIINICSMVNYDARGVAKKNMSERLAKDEDHTTIYRIIKIPVKFNVSINGIDKSIQLAGASDTDIKTGNFSKIENKKIEAIFDEYEGSNFNLGLALLGGGVSRGSNREGVAFRDFNFSLIISPPGGMGVNIGLSAYTYQLKISPSLQNAEVTYETTYVSSDKTIREDHVKEILDMNKILNIELEAE